MANASSVGISLPDRYRLEGHVAAGGMAAVYAAHDTLLDRPVAVKVLAEHLNSDVAARARFQREARAAASLSSHPGVVTVFDVGEHGGRSFIVMELRRGGTVADVLRRRGRIEPERALAWLRQAADALDAAHVRGIVHRDIKPANLLLDEHDRLAVADFGIARLAYEQQVTQTGQVLGTAAYLSPEQAVGEMATAASDRYALAVVAFELLTGTRPFQAEHFAAQARAHIEDPPPAATGRAADLPPAVDDVLRRGMAKDPGERWPTARAFVEALERALAEATAQTRAMGPRGAAAGAPAAGAAAAGAPPPGAAAGAATAGAPAAAPHASTPGRPPRPARARRAGSAAMFAAILALLAIAVVAIVGAATGGGDGNDRQTARSTATAEPDTAREPATAGTATPESTPDATSTPAPASDPSALNAQGYELLQAGDYAASIPLFQQAVEACGDSLAVDPCAYATYNLGAALNRSGNPADAIPILQQRLDRWPSDQPGTVYKELKSACKAVGQKCRKPGKGDDD